MGYATSDWVELDLRKSHPRSGWIVRRNLTDSALAARVPKPGGRDCVKTLNSGATTRQAAHSEYISLNTHLQWGANETGRWARDPLLAGER